MSDLASQDTVYVTYIHTTPEKLWWALTDGEVSPKYFFGRRVESDWKVGASFKMWQANGTLDVSGKVLESNRPRKLSVTWRVEWVEELRHLPESIITYQLDPLGEVVRLTMTESHPEPIEENFLKAAGAAGR